MINVKNDCVSLLCAAQFVARQMNIEAVSPHILSVIFLSLPLLQVGQLSVTGESIHVLSTGC